MTREEWDLPRDNAFQSATTHGLYSGAGSITYWANGTDYDFTWRPIDIADAIAKAHDMDYAEVVREGNPQGYVEDVRTLEADLIMVRRVDAVLNGLAIQGVEEPVRADISGETEAALLGQRVVINWFAIYKRWKIDQPNNGEGITIFDPGVKEAFISAGESISEQAERSFIIERLRSMESDRLGNE